MTSFEIVEDNNDRWSADRGFVPALSEYEVRVILTECDCRLACLIAIVGRVIGKLKK